MRITFVDSVLLFSLNSILNLTHPRKGDCMRSLKQYFCVPVFFVSVMVMVFSMVFSIEAKTYYINDTTKTSNNGTMSLPWHADSISKHFFFPGDSILFAWGSTDTAKPSDTFMPAYERTNKSYKHIHGFVCLQDSVNVKYNDSTKPIVVSTYGSGNVRPIISAKGLKNTAAILLYNSHYHWTIQNIEVRNCPRSYNWHDSGYSQSRNFAEPNASSRSAYLNWRWGIFAYYDDGNIHRDITIRHCAVDSVLGGDAPFNGGWGFVGIVIPWWDEAYVNNYVVEQYGYSPKPVDQVVGAWSVGGIMIRADGATGTSGWDTTGSRVDGPTTVDSVSIDSNNVHDIFGEGIVVGNDSVSSTTLFDNNVGIIGDTVLRTAEIAVHLIGGTDSAIISGNIIDSAGCGANNYTEATQSRISLGIVGIEMDFQKNAIIQYNAISNTVDWDTTTAAGVTFSATDAEAIDFDQNGGYFSPGHVIVQYNYSCNNGVSFFNSCMVPSDTLWIHHTDTLAIVRYNISQNDGIGYYLNANRGNPSNHPTQPEVIGDGSRGGNLIYNNVFYNDTGIVVSSGDTLYNGTTSTHFLLPPSHFINNIFLTRSSAGHIIWSENQYGNGGTFFSYNNWPNFNIRFSHNCYYDLADTSASDLAWPCDDYAGNNIDTFAIVANPNIKNPGKAVGGFLVHGGDSNEISSAKLCYLLNEPTPCFEAGLQIDKNGSPLTDFWGTSVSTFPYPDVGAYQTPTVETQLIPLILDYPMTTGMVSLNVFPHNDSVTEVFGTDNGDTNFYVYDSIPGAGYWYWPHKNINTFPNRQLPTSLVGQGYTIYSDRTDTIKVQGTSVDYTNTPVKLYGGQFYNQIAYLPQTDDSIDHALASLNSNYKQAFCMVTDVFGDIYEPADSDNGGYAIDEINVMHVGQAYYVRVSDSLTFTYPTPYQGVAKRVASNNGKPTLHLPEPHHYAIHAPTGYNDPVLVKQATIGGKVVPDLSEIGAFDASGSLVGSGTILKGVAAFVVWGQNPMVKQKDGLATGEPVTFKLWDGSSEYPLEFQSSNGSGVAYKAGAIFQGQMTVSGGYLITKFDLTQAYPNPFRGSVKISFDVPTIAGALQQAIEINVYDLKGSLVKQLASGKYQAGHYTVAWNCTEGREASMGSSVYIVRMKANNFDKRLKLLRVQ